MALPSHVTELGKKVKLIKVNFASEARKKYSYFKGLLMGMILEQPALKFLMFS